MTTWIQTYSGKKLDLLNPDPDAICLEDIIHSLALTNRFNGHTSRPYSVAEHSVWVSMVAADSVARDALAHDFVEFAIGDIVSPFKRSLRALGHNAAVGAVEVRVQQALNAKFTLTDVHDPLVTYADLAVLACEQRDLFPKMPKPWGLTVPPAPIVHIQCWDWETAKRELARRAAELDIR